MLQHGTFPAKTTKAINFTSQKTKECVAVLIGLYKKNGAVSRVGIDFCLIWSLYLVKTWLHHGVCEGSSYTWITSWTEFDYGQISIETATHSFVNIS